MDGLLSFFAPYLYLPFSTQSSILRLNSFFEPARMLMQARFFFFLYPIEIFFYLFSISLNFFSWFFFFSQAPPPLNLSVAMRWTFLPEVFK